MNGRELSLSLKKGSCVAERSKKGDPCSCSNYREITIGSITYQLFLRILPNGMKVNSIMRKDS